MRNFTARIVGDTQGMGRDWKRVDGIDLLRGLSIVFVMMNHVNMRLLFADVPYLVGLPKQLAYTIAWNGQFAVQMFFVISGYLITSTSIRRWGGPATLDVTGFYRLRVARIAPLFLLLLAVLTGLHVAHVHGYVVSAKTGGLGRALVAALTFHVGYLEATKDYLPANWDILWSLSVEEMFYLFFPLVARVLRRRWVLAVLLGLFIVAGPFARMKAFNPNEVWREYSYLGGMDGIAFGCLTAMWLAGRKLSRVWAYGLGGALIVVFCLGDSLQGYTWGLGRTGLFFSLFAVGVSLVIAAASQSGWKAPRVLAPLLVLGQRSYEIYLTHMFVVLGLFALFVRWGKPLKGVPVLFVGVIGLAGLVGWFVAVLFAEPVNRWIRRGERGVGVALPEVD